MSNHPIAISVPDTGEEEWGACREPLMSGWLTQGPKVAAFEKEFAARHGVKHALATTSCTTALHLILAAMEIGPGDEVIVPAFTWIATANVVLYCGAIPVFADVLPDTFNIDPEDVRKKVTPRTKAVLVVHLFGLCADMDAVRRAAPGVPLIEDAACAVGATVGGRSAGSLGLAGAFSFHPRKSITTGEGGMVTTQDNDLAECVNQLRSHGASISEEERQKGARPYRLPEFNLMGYNYRMTDLQGAVGLVQLSKLDGLINRRAEGVARYEKALADIPWLRLPRVPPGFQHGWQAYVTLVDETRSPCSRDDMMERLMAAGIHTRPGTLALHVQGLYREKFNFRPGDFPVADQCARHSLALPLHTRMTAEDYHRVADVLRRMG